MGIATGIGRLPRAPGKTRLGIDHPVYSHGFFDYAIECGRIGEQRCRRRTEVGPDYGLASARREKGRHRSDRTRTGQETALSAVNPTPLVERQTVTQDDAVDMRVIGEVFLLHECHTAMKPCLGTLMSWIGGKPVHCLGDGAELGRIDDALLWKTIAAISCGRVQIKWKWPIDRRSACRAASQSRLVCP